MTDDPESHQLSSEELTDIARGGVAPQIIRRLRAAELSKHKLLLEAVRRLGADVIAPDDAAAFAAALRVLEDVQARTPAVADAVLALPQVGGWALDCLGGLGTTKRLEREDIDYLATMAAVAGIRAGIPFEITAPTRGHRVALPGLGRLTMTGADDRVARVRLDSDGVTISRGPESVRLPADLNAQRGEWTPVRRTRVQAGGLTLDVAIDSDDRFCERFHAPVSELDAADQQVWCDRIEECWRILVRHHRPFALMLTAGPVTLVPLAGLGLGRPYSATSGWTFGAIGASLPPDGLSLAVTLIHEFHHLVLGAVEDITPLVRSDANVVCYAPWRDDPRPLTGLFHGVYAHLAMIRFWRRHQAFGPREHHDRAEEEYARWRSVTLEAAGTLATAPHLTGAGRIIAGGMRDLLSSWRNEPLDVAAERRAASVNGIHRTRWRLAHLHPDPTAVERLAQAWLLGDGPLGDGPLGFAEVPVRLEIAGARLLERPRPLAERPEVIAALLARLRTLAPDPPSAEQLARWLTGVA